MKIAKDMQFNGVGFASNCTHLFEDVAIRLLDAKLDTIICSVDGATKETHESIRIGTDFDIVVENIINFINMRNKRNEATRVLLRYINQEANCHEWNEYVEVWESRLDKYKGDGVLRFDVHN